MDHTIKPGSVPGAPTPASVLRMGASRPPPTVGPRPRRGLPRATHAELEMLRSAVDAMGGVEVMSLRSGLSAPTIVRVLAGLPAHHGSILTLLVTAERLTARDFR